MMRSRLGLRAVVLCLALAGLMAAGASSAQAETGAYWLVSGKKFTTLLPTLTGTLRNADYIIKGAIGGVGMHLLCKVILYKNYHLLEPNGGLLGKKRFDECEFRRLKEGKAEKLAGCALPEGQFETNELKGLIRLSGGAPVVVLEPTSGTTIATIALGEECAFGEKITISGKLGLQDAEFLTDLVAHTFKEDTATTELYFNGNKANKATTEGEIEVKLAEAHAGLTWSGHPA